MVNNFLFLLLVLLVPIVPVIVYYKKKSVKITATIKLQKKMV
jgi:hypothetical protein